MGAGLCSLGDCHITAMPNLEAGSYKLCHRKLGSTVYEEISGLELEVVPLPSFSPLGGMSGTVTQITFSGTLPGDYIVFNEVNDCDNAHTIGTGIGSLAKTALDGQNRLSTVTAMSAARPSRMRTSNWAITLPISSAVGCGSSSGGISPA